MGPNPQETAELVTFTEESLIENFIFCAVLFEFLGTKITCVDDKLIL